ncbi:nitrilase-related carbon-nitrogen hydrolase [Algoriphagus hitonicola]|uniref:Carbon-nitrogen hydrolase n=1 Tax=Algoriphagus hitonicola TaxID=435880 RepID=A0A1I2VQM3_9BACT|nr:nitrilase-related carbon-nitrogen hydrolase [Algoriphagus hitonicola]SFG91462.1 Carbon-nitrogen hydrolase [Algoriphagus hitonicola]
MKRFIISAVLLLIFIWLIWSNTGRGYPLPPPEMYLDLVQELNPSDTLNRNILGIQPYMETRDYLNQDVFYSKLNGYLTAADQEGLVKRNSLILFPEYIGTWLVISGEKHAIAEKEKLEDAMSTLIISNLVDFGLSYFKAREENRKMGALFRMKSSKMAREYYYAFSRMAQEQKCYIAAGSIILPGPGVADGELIIDNSKPLYNASFIFGPDGKIIGQPVLKAFPIESEKSFLGSATTDDFPIFNLPMGKTSLLICADSWYPEFFQLMDEEEVEIVLVPSFLAEDRGMDRLWMGYTGASAPVGTDLNDIEKISEWEAWNKYALPAKINNTKAKVALNVFLRGNLWDLGSDGQAMAYFNGQHLDAQKAERAGIWSLNF